ncbi:MAG: DUF3857 domain-containing protein, partial [Cyclobacteriaceae bacterium]
MEAYSYNRKDGKVVKTKVDPELIVDEKIYANNWVKKFVFPKIEEGSIIEYSYNLESPYMLSLPDWEFQDEIPTMYSQYSVSMIPFYEYVFTTQGIDTLDVQEVIESKEQKSAGKILSASGQNMGPLAVYNERKYVYGLRDVEAFRDEKYITSRNDYIKKIDFQLSNIYNVGTQVSDQYESLAQAEVIMTSWPQMVEDLFDQEYFGDYLEDCEKEAKKLLKSEISLEGMADEKKARTLIEYIKNNITWDGYRGVFANKSPKELIEQKTGNVAEINLFMNVLLNTAGITAHPVMLSTRDHGKVNYQYPFLRYFNYVVTLVSIGNSSFLADGSDPDIGYKRIPPQTINEQGLIIDKDNVGWVRLDSKILSRNNKLITIELDAAKLMAECHV